MNAVGPALAARRESKESSGLEEWTQAEPRQGADEGERGLESEGTRHFPSPAARLNLTLTRNMLRAFADSEYATGQNL